MSTRDRFFSSLSSAQDQLYSRLDSLAAGRPGGAGPSSSSAGTSHAQQHYGQPPGTSGSDDPLPLYARDQPSNAAHIPASVLAAPPGQAQEAYDSMPRSRLENPRVPDRERRKAAEELRRNQEMLHAGPSGSGSNGGNGAGGSMTQEQRAMGLKTVHSYAAGSGKAILDIHTLPQRSPTFMGGSADRGRGALQGQAVLFTQDGERVSAVRLKIKAVSRIALPRSHLSPSNDPNRRSAGPPPSGPVVLSGRSPRSEPTTAKEHLLLQLEKTLWSSDSTSRTAPDGSRPDPTVWQAGRHVFDFKIDLPATSKDGKDLPPSFVFLADSTASATTVQNARRQQQSLGDSLSAAKKWVEQASAGAIGQDEWASIKWYVKLTVERPGLFKTNERIFAPFVYLPPPSRKVQERVLPNRVKMSTQVRQSPTIPGDRLAEPLASWGSADLDLNATGVGTKAGRNSRGSSKGSIKDGKDGSGGGGGMWSRIFKGPALAGNSTTSSDGSTPRWSIALPNQPAIWPLKSTLPYQIRVQGGPGGLRPPIVALFLRVTLLNAGKGLLSSKNAPQSGTETRLIAVGRVYGGENVRSPSAKSNASAMTQTWRGVLDLPPQATPDFESPLVDTEYFLGVQKEAGSRIVWAQKVLLVCNMPAVVVRRNNPTGAAQNGRGGTGTVRGVRRVPSASRRSSAGRAGGATTGGTIRANGKTAASPPPAKAAFASGKAPARPDEAARRQPSSSSTLAAAGPSTPGKQQQQQQHRVPPQPASTPPSRRGTPSPGSSRLPSSSSANIASSSNTTPPSAAATDARRRPDPASRRGSSASSGVASGPPSSIAAAYPAEKGTAAQPQQPPQQQAAEPSSSRRARREHEASTFTSSAPAPAAASRSSSRAPSEHAPSTSGHGTVVTDDGDDANWILDTGGAEEGMDGENLEDMGMDMPPSYWEATQEVRGMED